MEPRPDRYLDRESALPLVLLSSACGFTFRSAWHHRGARPGWAWEYRDQSLECSRS